MNIHLLKACVCVNRSLENTDTSNGITETEYANQIEVNYQLICKEKT